MIIIIEGIRRSGKTYFFNLLKEIYPDYKFYKDKGLYLLKDNPINIDVDIDSFVVGRDLALTQFISQNKINNIIIDRQYWSSYVYGQLYRNKYDKVFWVDHLHLVEYIYKTNHYLDKVLVLLLYPTNDSVLEKISKLDRKKDELETNDIEIYKKQLKLYDEILKFTTVQYKIIPAHLEKEKLVKIAKNLSI